MDQIKHPSNNCHAIIVLLCVQLFIQMQQPYMLLAIQELDQMNALCSVRTEIHNYRDWKRS